MSAMAARVKKKADQACSSSKKLANLAHDLSDQLDALPSSGVPMRPVTDDDSMVTSIENVLAGAERAKRTTGRP